MSSLGTWEPEAADPRAKVLTNGFETCLRSHGTSPWPRGSSWPGCLCFGGLPPPPLFSPPPSTRGCGPARGDAGRAEVQWDSGYLAAPHRDAMSWGQESGPFPPPPPPLSPPPFPLSLPLLPYPAELHTWPWAVLLPPGLAALRRPPQEVLGGQHGLSRLPEY